LTTDITKISGIGPSTAEVLKQHGFSSAEDIAGAPVERVAEVPGFGPARAGRVQAAARALLEGAATAPSESATVTESPRADEQTGKKGKKTAKGGGGKKERKSKAAAKAGKKSGKGKKRGKGKKGSKKKKK